MPRVLFAFVLVALGLPLAAFADLASALDLPGDALWLDQGGITHDGADAARSGAINDDESSSLSVVIFGPSTLTFYWKVSSEQGHDKLNFYIDEALQPGDISGEVDWQLKTHQIPSGTRALPAPHPPPAQVRRAYRAHRQSTDLANPAAWVTVAVTPVVVNPDADGDGLVELVTVAVPRCRSAFVYSYVGDGGRDLSIGPSHFPRCQSGP